MLRFDHRWHDAANGPLTGEARPLFFASGGRGGSHGGRGGHGGHGGRGGGHGGSTSPGVSPIGPEPDETPDTGGEEETAPQDDVQADDADRLAEAMAEFNRRTQEQVRLANEQELIDAYPEKPSTTAEVLTRARTLDTNLTSLLEDVARLEELLHETNAGESHLTELHNQEKTLLMLRRRTREQISALESLRLEAWESGEMLPSEFLKNFDAYLDRMKQLDEQDVDENDNPRYSRTQRTKRTAARELYRVQARKAVEDIRKTMPTGMPPDLVQRGQNVTDEELWKLYTPEEKRAIIQRVSDAAGATLVKESTNADVLAMAAVLEKAKLEEKFTQVQMVFNEEKKRLSKDPNAARAPDPIVQDDHLIDWEHPFAGIKGAFNDFNEATGLQWLTAYEWYQAFNEVIESAKELRKRNSLRRVSRAALLIGRAASLVPGMGGADLVNVLEEQQQHKNDEVKDDFVKELKNSRNDPGFSDLFGDGKGKQGMLKYYAQIGDTNRTRGIIEYAAGKALLFGIDRSSWNTYVLPGGILFKDVLPKEWTDGQKQTYFENTQFDFNKGISNMVKVGEDLVTGRANLEGYTEPFKGAVNGMALWVAKGIANKALTKVKNGEMSALLTLIVLDAWEKNPLFRKYASEDWYDRLAGDSKQLMVGMIKYDQAHLIGAARGEFDGKPVPVTTNLGEARNPHRGNPRLGPLVVAIRQHLLKKDPSLANKPADFMRKTAQVMAAQVVTLDNGQTVSIFAPELLPYQIQYGPNEMRGANIEALGDDFFIEPSEIINGTVEVMKAVGEVTHNGFRSPEKARYYFSHIIDTYTGLVAKTKTHAAAGRTAESQEMARAAEQFRIKLRKQLNEWAKYALNTPGAPTLVTIWHAKQDGRYLLSTLLEHDLISRSVIESLASEGNKPAQSLLRQFDELHKPNVRPQARRPGDAGAASGTVQPTTAA